MQENIMQKRRGCDGEKESGDMGRGLCDSDV